MRLKVAADMFEIVLAGGFRICETLDGVLGDFPKISDLSICHDKAEQPVGLVVNKARHEF